MRSRSGHSRCTSRRSASISGNEASSACPVRSAASMPWRQPPSPSTRPPLVPSTASKRPEAPRASARASAWSAVASTSDIGSAWVAARPRSSPRSSRLRGRASSERRRSIASFAGSRSTATSSRQQREVRAVEPADLAPGRARPPPAARWRRTGSGRRPPRVRRGGSASAAPPARTSSSAPPAWPSSLSSATFSRDRKCWRCARPVSGSAARLPAQVVDLLRPVPGTARAGARPSCSSPARAMLQLGHRGFGRPSTKRRSDSASACAAVCASGRRMRATPR